MPPRAYGSCTGALGADDVEWRDEEEILARTLLRLGTLRRRGCEEPDCVVLAGRLDVGLDDAIGLIERGCPPGLAVRILV
ncbi:hypothetical protein Gocc_0641 [Gaiella occulta]|uniref:Uncharacterized protein n=1 Tax=Gaiella occulta TaxID=1002870 RepID=A0A7M2Z2K4_9ACTN|nr:hypothetical protein [Gaiella occulta]RDI76222.1 hypothetical protein Gocc_0641 [Gaiella occulta]